MPSAGGQELAPQRRFFVDQGAGQQYRVKRAVKVPFLDPAADGRQIRDMGEHRPGIVHSEHLMAQAGQRAQDAAGAAAQLRTDAPSGTAACTISASPTGGSSA
jgi:hypothetical protein